MIVFTMTDQEILKELDKEINRNDLIRKLDYQFNKSFPMRKRSKAIEEKCYGSLVNDYMGIINPLDDTVVIPMASVSIKTVLNNEFIIVYSEALDFDKKTRNFILKKDPKKDFFLRVPGKYKYYPEKGKEAVIRTGNHYFQILFKYDYDHPYRYPKISFIRITAHFLDRIYQRSEMFRETVNINNLSSIQALESFLIGFTPLTISEELYDNFITKFSEETIVDYLKNRGDCDSAVIENLLSIKRGIAKHIVAGGCLLYIPGVDGRQMPVYKTFLTLEQTRMFDKEMLLRRKDEIRDYLENDLGLPYCYY